MAEIEIYTTPTCPYCLRAKALLDKKGAAYREINVSAGREVMTKRAGGRTSVPQIFINGEHIGGCDDLHALDAAGELDAKLAACA
ncbi:MAG: glutaredoxin 3 [Rhodospirillaceae bacterium]|nr:glutaredoxin 3 [Rhodospirillales bacterium]